MDKTQPQVHAGQARSMIDLFSDAQAVLADAERLRKLSELAQTARQAPPTGHRRKSGKDGQAEPLMNTLTDELDVPAQHDARPAVVSRHVQRVAEQQVHADLMRDIHASVQGQRALSSLNGSGLVVSEIVTVRDAVHDPAKPALVAELVRERLRLLHVVEDRVAVRKRHEGQAPVERHVNRLLYRLPRLRQVRERFQRLLEKACGFAACRTLEGLYAGLTLVGSRLVPNRPARRVLGQ